MQATNYRADVDGLRAVAVAAVVVFHAFPSLLPGGFVGVDVFFVISGYLIGGIIMNGLDKGRFTFADFYLRRIRRIFPALIVVLAAVYALGRFVLLPDEFAQLGEDTVASVFFVQNFNLWSQAGYFDSAAHTKPLLHIWSLAVEEQFYIFYPFLMWIVWKMRVNALWILIGLMLASFAANILSVGSNATMTFYFPHTRVWELLLGAAIARYEMVRTKGELPLPIATACAIVGAALLAYAFVVTREGMGFPGWIALAPTVGTALLVFAGPRSPLNRYVLANPLMVWIGLISYPLYLWHWPLLSYARILEGPDLETWVALSCVGASIVLAAATYLAIERPIRFRPVSVRIAGAAAAMLLAVGVAGFLASTNLITTADASMRPQAATLQNVEEALANWGGDRQDRPGCHDAYPQVRGGFCVHQPQGVPDIAVIGDSHANSIYYGLERIWLQQGRSPIMFGRHQCAPLFDTSSYLADEVDPCREMTNRQLEFALSSPSIRTIVLAGRWANYDTAYGFSEDDRGEARVLEFGDMRAAGVDDWRAGRWREGQHERFEAAFRSTLQRLSQSDKEIIVLYDWPEHRQEMRECLGEPESCAIPRAEVLERQRGYRDIFAAVAREHPNVRFIDPLPVLCTELCPMVGEDGTVLYLDDDHLSIYGSDFVARVLAPQMR